MRDEIRHEGRVVEVRDGEVDVLIVPQSACGSCRSRSMCAMSENTEKIITVADGYSSYYKVGDAVDVSTEKIMGIKAVFVAYVYPFVGMLACLLILLKAGLGELTAGLSALGFVALYFLGLMLFRNKLQREIIFKISPKA